MRRRGPALAAAPLGGSVGTGPDGVEADVVEATSLEAVGAQAGELARHVAAVEADSGAGRVRGFGWSAGESAAPRARRRP